MRTRLLALALVSICVIASLASYRPSSVRAADACADVNYLNAIADDATSLTKQLTDDATAVKTGADADQSRAILVARFVGIANTRHKYEDMNQLSSACQALNTNWMLALANTEEMYGYNLAIFDDPKNASSYGPAVAAQVKRAQHFFGDLTTELLAQSAGPTATFSSTDLAQSKSANATATRQAYFDARTSTMAAIQATQTQRADDRQSTFSAYSDTATARYYVAEATNYAAHSASSGGDNTSSSSSSSGGGGTLCNDGTYSFSTGSGTCSHHKGVAK